MLAGSYATPAAGPQGRLRRAHRMTARADGMDGARITGIFSADGTELLPMSWALAKAGAQGYDPS